MVPTVVAATFLPLPATAQGYAWGDGYYAQDIYRDLPPARPTRPARPLSRVSVLPKGADKAEKLAVEGKKPQGPLVIAISIQRQQVKVYDANGLFAESPISSGMPGHATPMGVFSIIQKHKFHRSNIYSGAPMPYMQRITWSGVAMHAGVLPGYPASHGCIRLPMSFAMKIWGWTKMGARVVVTPGEVSPADFASPTLAALVPPTPVALMPVAAGIRTADASGSMVGSAPKVVADIAVEGTAVTTEMKDVESVGSIVAAEATSTLGSAEIATEDGLPSIPTPVAIDLSDIERPAELQTTAEIIIPPAESVELLLEAKVAVAPVEVASPSLAPPSPAPTPKDQTQILPTPPESAPIATSPLIKRHLPVAIFVSRKDGKIYVRQNFTPLFDMPIEIAAAEKALGTHVFTARPAKDDEGKLQWSVVSIPAVARQASAANDDRNNRRRSGAAAVVPIASGTADEALSRLTIPADFMSRLGDALPTGSSLVVSDQGISQGETGSGTDFIVRLR